MNRLSSLPWACFALLLVALPGFPTPRPGDLKRDLAKAQSILAGEVTRVYSYYSADGEIYSDVTLRVAGILKQSGPTADSITFTAAGGIVGDEGMAYSNSPFFTENEPVLVMLEEWTPGTLSPASKYELDGRYLPELQMRGGTLLETIREALTEQGEVISDAEWSRVTGFEKNHRKANEPYSIDPENPLASCYVITGPRWRTTNVQFRLDNALPADMRTSILAAVSTINNLNLSLRFQSSAFGTNLVSRGAITTGNPGTLAVARYRFIPSSQTMVDYTITFNHSFSWASSGAGGTFDTEGVALHEFGHIAGLNHPTPQICDQHTMWFSVGSGDTSRRTLEVGDTAGFQAIYGTVAPPPPPPSAPQPTPPPSAGPGSAARVPMLSSLKVDGRLVTNSTLTLVITGTNFTEFLQFVVRGQGCPSTGCILSGAAVRNLTATSAFSNFVPRGTGTYRVNVRNTALGHQSAEQFGFTVFIR